MRANIINIDGNNANCGQFSMVDGTLYNGTFKIGFDEQQLMDLSVLLSWWRQSRSEQEVAEPEVETKETWFNYPEAPAPKAVPMYEEPKCYICGEKAIGGCIDLIRTPIEPLGYYQFNPIPNSVKQYCEKHRCSSKIFDTNMIEVKNENHPSM